MEKLPSPVPEYIWMLVLSILPVKTLIRFQTVSKSFFALIHGSNFINFHIHRFLDNLQQTQILVQADRECHVLRESDDFALIPQSRLLLPTTRWCIMGSVDGLVLVIDENRNPILWNPSIRKIRKLPSPSSTTNFETLQCVLGCDLGSDDYKVLAMTGRDRVWVYSLKTDSWTAIESGFMIPREELTRPQGLSLNGWLFWSERHNLVCFNFERNEFGCAKMPYWVDIDENSPLISRLLLLDGGSCIGVWGESDFLGLCIWSLSTSDMSWSLRYKMSMDVLRRGMPVGCARRNGELVLKQRRSVDGVSFCSYNMETQAIRDHGVLSPPIVEKIDASSAHCCHRDPSYLGVYVESLVML